MVWLSATAKILIIGQAPGAKVYESGRPFADPSGDRLRDWMQISQATFYDRTDIAILPMAFCFPGYNKQQADLAPPRRCATTWQQLAIAQMPNVRLTLLVGGYAQKWHLPDAGSVTETVASWRKHAPNVFPLPHPSWRNTGWLKRNNWFATELLPALRSQIKLVMHD
ncbi:MAG: uracil-DNA glycosylase family protein [Paracoccaceae bacterium]